MNKKVDGHSAPIESGEMPQPRLPANYESHFTTDDQQRRDYEEMVTKWGIYHTEVVPEPVEIIPQEGAMFVLPPYNQTVSATHI